MLHTTLVTSNYLVAVRGLTNHEKAEWRCQKCNATPDFLLSVGIYAIPICLPCAAKGMTFPVGFEVTIKDLDQVGEPE